MEIYLRTKTYGNDFGEDQEMKLLDFIISQADSCQIVIQSKVNRRAAGHVQILMDAIAFGFYTLAVVVGHCQFEFKQLKISYLRMWSLS
jgi:hypothetical protein